MAATEPRNPQDELAARLQILMFLRVLFVSLLLGASVFIQVRDTRTYFGDIQTAHYVLIAAIYFLTVVYIFLLKIFKDLVRLAYVQLLMDTLTATAVIFATGGIESIFTFLYILTIITGSILLYRGGGLLVASFSSFLYSMLLLFQSYEIVQPIGRSLAFPAVYRSNYLLYMILVNVAAFYLVAFLSSYLAEQARRSGVELKARQEDIVQLEALNEWIIRSITSGLITLDRERRVILFNPAAEEIFGIPSRQAISRNVAEVLPCIQPHLEPTDNGSPPWARWRRKFIDLDYVRPDGKKVFLRCSVSPLSLPEGIQSGEILSFQDLTELKQIEEEMKKVEGLALIGELAAGIAHEVRNPLASISGSIQMLKEDPERTEVSAQLMDIVLREIGRLNNLVSDFLLFARPKSMNVETFDLNQLILDTLAIFRQQERTSRIRVETDFSEGISVESDPGQIRQVLWNLFLNACEAMPEGGRLHVKTERVNPDGPFPQKGEVAITIRDTGQGFSPKALSQLFTPFSTTKEGGTGLGLAVVKRIVEGLKGTVLGRNHEEGGAEIRIVLRQGLRERPNH
jgi:two-component system, NtrC family, sensor histidine kinase PilS